MFANAEVTLVPENLKTAHGQAPEVKADSRYVRFVIAKHSPEQVLETGLLMEPLEKTRCNRCDAGWPPFSLVRFV